MAFDIDLLAAGKAPLQLLGENAGSTEPPDQLPTRFRTLGGTTLIGQNGVCDIAKTPSDAKTTISVGQRLRAVRQLVAGILLPPRYPAANRPLFPKPEPPFCTVVSGSSIVGDYAPGASSSQGLVGLSRRHTRRDAQSPVQHETAQPNRGDWHRQPDVPRGSDP